MFLRRKEGKDAKTRDDKEREQFLSICPNHKDGRLFIVGVNSKDNDFKRRGKKGARNKRS